MAGEGIVMNRRRAIGGMTAFALLGGACGARPGGPAPEPVVTRMPVLRDVDGLAIGVDPFADPERQRQVFGASLTSAGVVAIQLLAENRSTRTILLRRSDMALLVDVKRYPAIGSVAVSSRLSEIGAVMGGAFAFGVFGVLATGSSQDAAHAARVDDYDRKEFKDATLAPGASARGFIFVIPPDATAAFDAGTLQIKVVDVETGRGRLVDLPLTGLGFPGAVAVPAS